MPQIEFDIAITESSVDVRHDVSSKSPRGRFYVSLFLLVLAILGDCYLVFSHGKNDDPSMWHYLSTSPLDSSDFIVPAMFVVLFVVVLGYVLARYTLAAYPSDETFHCDRFTLTVSKIPWMDVNNSNWITQSFHLADISRLRYGRIASVKGASIYGIRFLAAGKKQKVLPGLEAPEAAEILRALQVLGADVLDDPKLSKRVQETLRNRWPY